MNFINLINDDFNPGIVPGRADLSLRLAGRFQNTAKRGDLSCPLHVESFYNPLQRLALY
jgi:hypothetical protein